MLRITESLVPIVINHLVLIQVSNWKSRRTEELRSLKMKLEIAIVRAIIDSFIVGGISFFASLVALGTVDISVNIEMCFLSATTMAGLAFFNEMKSQMGRK
uniref:Uncharacterized protein n=1 Tax=viral metagenome TaxID=1070528 RepID=A0A6M3LDX6_9ZZZZ